VEELGLIACTKSDADMFIDVREVDRDTLEPILFLLQSQDIEVQRAASAALGNLAVNSKFDRYLVLLI
jgi:vacuolar protein 8